MNLPCHAFAGRRNIRHFVLAGCRRTAYSPCSHTSGGEGVASASREVARVPCCVSDSLIGLLCGGLPFKVGKTKALAFFS